MSGRLVVAVTLLVTACRGVDSPGSRPLPPGRAALEPAGGLLAKVPADTPFVYAQLDALPEEYLDGQLLDQARTYQRLRRELDRVAKDHPEVLDELDEETKLLLALTAELEGRMSRQGLRELGIDYGGRFVLYGLGIWPVLRLELADGARFAAAVERVITRLGVTLPVLEHRGRRLWHLGAATGHPGLDVVFGVDADHLVVALTPTGRARDTHLDRLLTGPSGRTLAESGALAVLSARHQFGSGAVGYIDWIATAKLAAAAIPGLEAECAEELPALFELMPRWIVGTRVSGSERLSVRAIVELRSDLREALDRARTVVPGMARKLVEMHPFAVGVALDPVTMADYALPRLSDFSRARARCSLVRAVQGVARDTEGQLAAAMSSDLRSLLGFTLVLANVDIEGDVPTAIDAALLIGSREPEVMLELLGDLVPGDHPTAVRGGPPVPFDVPLVSALPMLGRLHLALGDRGTGVSTGDGVSLLSWLAREPAAGMPLFLLHSDGTLWQRLSRVAEVYLAGEAPGGDTELARAMAAVEHSGPTAFTIQAQLDPSGVRFEVEVVSPTPNR